MDGNKSLSKALKMDNYVEKIGEEFGRLAEIVNVTFSSSCKKSTLVEKIF
jgi:hypothetical protein